MDGTNANADNAPISQDYLQEKDERVRSEFELICEGEAVTVEFTDENGEKADITGTVVKGNNKANPSGGLKGHRLMIDVDGYESLIKVATDRFNGYDAPVYTESLPEQFGHELFGEDAVVYSQRDYAEYQIGMAEAEAEAKMERMGAKAREIPYKHR